MCTEEVKPEARTEVDPDLEPSWITDLDGSPTED